MLTTESSPAHATPAATALAGAGAGQAAVPDFLNSRYLRRVQARAAVITIVLPTLAALLAVYLGISYGFRLVDLLLLAVMHVVTMLGITVGYHRLLAHKSFQAGPVVRRVLLAMGAMAAQGPPIQWVCNHRLHHQYSDEDKDLHSPHAPRGGWRGFWHAHLSWMFDATLANPAQYGRDLLQDPAVKSVNKHYALLVVAGILLPGAIGAALAADPWMGALGGVLWGGLVRIFTVHHVTWCTNSITHLFGPRPYRSDDRSTNVAWLAPLSAGESWHNCHHAFPRSARFGLSWWQFDLGWLLIRLLEVTGLATEVHVPSREARDARRATAAV